jgi:GTPase SAR1 family protein
MSSIDKVRIVVVGDSGCGKSAFVHLIAHNEIHKSLSWTVKYAISQ